MKRFNNSPEMLIVAVGLIFVSIIMLSTLFYTPKPATATVIHTGERYEISDNKINEEIQPETVLDENNEQTNIDNVTGGNNEIISESINPETTAADNENYLININTADAETLTKLNGIGPSKAQKIIDYRSSNGNFKSIEEITNVSGIGEKTFEKIKNNITV